MIKASEALEKTKKYWAKVSEEFINKLNAEIEKEAEKGQYTALLYFQPTDPIYMKDYVVNRCRAMGYQARHSEVGRNEDKKYYVVVRWD